MSVSHIFQKRIISGVCRGIGSDRHEVFCCGPAFSLKQRLRIVFISENMQNAWNKCFWHFSLNISKLFDFQNILVIRKIWKVAKCFCFAWINGKIFVQRSYNRLQNIFGIYWISLKTLIWSKSLTLLFG